MKRHNVFIEEINKIAISADDNKKMQSIDSIKTNAYGAISLYYERNYKNS